MLDVSAIDAVLPQTQCRECGFNGCLPYAEALLTGKTTIDRCVPGGLVTLKALGQLLQIEIDQYEAKVIAQQKKPSVAKINEAECIGCAKCIKACPVDAIVGSAKLMHTVLSDECSGCGLCVEPCPVDCIEMLPQTATTFDKTIAKKRYQAKRVREIADIQTKQQQYRKQQSMTTSPQDLKLKLDYIQKALARVKLKNN